MVPTGEIFRYWLQGGRIVIELPQRGPGRPLRQHQHRDRRLPPAQVRLPGAGGAPEIAEQPEVLMSSARSPPSSTSWPSSSVGARRGRRLAPAPRPAGQGAGGDHHRPVHHGAGSRQQRVRGHFAASGVTREQVVRPPAGRSASPSGSPRRPSPGSPRAASRRAPRPRPWTEGERRMSREVFICDAVRTPIGGTGGGLPRCAPTTSRRCR